MTDQWKVILAGATLLVAGNMNAEEETTMLPNQVEAMPEVIAGGQPSEDSLRAAAAAGYATVVNLRTEGEDSIRGDVVETLGMKYLELPIAGAAGLTEENARAFAALLEKAELPAIVHCGSGNRVGAMFALKAFHVDGATAEEALAVGRASGLTGLEPVVRQRLGIEP